jgi:hypothetical protein
MALGLADRIGTLEPGSDADLVVLDAGATPAMAMRLETVDSLADELFLLQILGDDRAVAETYIAGRPMKNRTGYCGGAFWNLGRRPASAPLAPARSHAALSDRP